MGVHHRAGPTHQRTALAALRVQADGVFVDHGLTGTIRARPGLREALAACRRGSQFRKWPAG